MYKKITHCFYPSGSVKTFYSATSVNLTQVLGNCIFFYRKRRGIPCTRCTSMTLAAAYGRTKEKKSFSEMRWSIAFRHFIHFIWLQEKCQGERSSGVFFFSRATREQILLYCFCLPCPAAVCDCYTTFTAIIVICLSPDTNRRRREKEKGQRWNMLG